MRRLFTLILIVAPSITFGQFVASVHMSNLPFVGVGYDINAKLRPELRIGINNYFKSTAVEAVLTYDLVNKEDYEFYGGLGARINNFGGVVIPVGLNIYPFTTKKLGFHAELAPIIGPELLRGSWGIRYRFRKEE